MNMSKPISPFRLTSLLRLQKDPKLALQLFQNPNPNTNRDRSPKSSLKPFRYSMPSYDILITKLGRAKMFEEMENILQQLKAEKRCVPKEALFCNIIAYYGRAHRPYSAQKVFDEIPSFRCERTVKSYNSLLNAFLVCGKFDRMRELFVDIERFVNPDACTYNILIRGFCVSGRVDDARKVFDEMPKRGASPTVTTFGNLIHGLCSDSRVNEAFKLKSEMAGVYGVRPNAHVYSALIKGFSRIGEFSLAFRIKEEMIADNILLDSAIYSTLIAGLFKAGKKEEARRLFHEMSASGCKPDTVTYNVMISGFCKEKDFEAAFRVLNEMMEKGCKPDVISYNVILAELCKEGKWSEANDVFQDMPKSGCTPDIVSYRTIFDGLSDGMQIKEAAFILDEMIFKSFAPRPSSVYKFVERLYLEKNDDLLWSVFDGLSKGNAIDAALWRLAISMALKDDKLSSSVQLVDVLQPCLQVFLNPKLLQ